METCKLLDDIFNLINEVVIGTSITASGKSMGGLVKQSQSHLVNYPGKLKVKDKQSMLSKKPTSSLTNNTVLNPLTPINQIGNQKKKQLIGIKTQNSANVMRSPHP